jgi:hypothetical protein
VTIETLPGSRTRRTSHRTRGAGFDYARLDTNGAGVVVEHWVDDRLRDRDTVYWGGQDPGKKRGHAGAGGLPTDQHERGRGGRRFSRDRSWLMPDDSHRVALEDLRGRSVGPDLGTGGEYRASEAA